MTMLSTSASVGADGPVVMLSGEADTTTATALLREMLAAQLDTGARLVTVDASGLVFLDSACLRVLVLAARALQGRHGTLVFARPQPRVARLLEITGADRLLEVREWLAPDHGLDACHYRTYHHITVVEPAGPVLRAAACLARPRADQPGSPGQIRILRGRWASG